MAVPDGAAIAALQRFVAYGELPRPGSEADASALVEQARVHGLAPLLDEAGTAAGASWPGAAAAALRDLHRRSLSHNLRVFGAARRARVLLAQAGLRTLALKGLALAESVYDSPAHRPMADADLLLLDDWQPAVALLERNGFAVRERAPHAWALIDPEAGVTLELHRGLSACPELFPIDAAGLWMRRSGSPGAERPSTEDLLVQLAVHAAFQHGMAIGLVQYLDFRRLLERASPDHDRLLEHASAAGAEACLLASLVSARELVAAPVPEGLFAPLRRSSSRLVLRRIDGLGRRPLDCLRVSPAAIAGWRLLLVPGRRLELLARTLVPEQAGSALERARLGMRRGLALLRQTLG